MKKKYQQKTAARKGYTLIELMVVIAIIGSLLFLTYQLLTGIWRDKFTGDSGLQIEGLFEKGREYAFANGKTLVLEINLEKEEMSLREKKEMEKGPSQIYSEKFTDDYRKNQSDKEEDNEEGEENETKWLIEPVNIPDDISDIYSVSGLKLIGPVIHLYFYPNGTTDSVIIQFNRTVNQYMYIPRHNTTPVYIDNLDFQEEDISGGNE
ncbi:MAG: prepilin-type N-terminal cleavage/methylation domain-containing protein [Spirochaetia bacterium]|nr:prepilin-type N-terminal cleavage/methylation domain-containing protein [Spirochaetia bacterium]